MVESANSQTDVKTSAVKSEKGVSSKKKTGKRVKKEQKFVCQYPASVVNVVLNQIVINLKCLPTDEDCEGNRIIKVRTDAVDNGEMKYVYIVSAGKIIGEGATVEWDLSDAKPGIYTITAAIAQPFLDTDRWEVFGLTKTKTVTVKE